MPETNERTNNPHGRRDAPARQLQPRQRPWIEPADDDLDATAPLDFKKTVRIAVTGDVLLTPTEVAVIDTRDFQRLRGVRQLGATNLVYPTALHTRFDHSLGTLAKADEMVLSIATNAKSTLDERQISLAQRKLARMYALLHDVPHVPFGHTIEDELRLFTRHDKNLDRILHFLGPESAIGRVLQEAGPMQNRLPFGKPSRQPVSTFYDRLMAIYLWEEDPQKRDQRASDADAHELSRWFEMHTDDALVHDIVSNTVCADLLDYVARDNYFCNLGISLEYRFLKYLYLRQKQGLRIPAHTDGENRNGNRRVFVRLWKKGQGRPRRDLLTDLTRLMNARYLIAERAYFHHTKLVTSAMLGRAVQEYRGQHGDESWLYEETDQTLLQRLCDWEERQGWTSVGPDVPLALTMRLTVRNLHRTVEEYGDAEFDRAHKKWNTGAKSLALETLRDPESRRDFENWYSKMVGRPPGAVLIYAPSPKMNMKVAEINVRWNGTNTTLGDINDPVVRPRLANIIKAHENLWSISLVVAREVGESELQCIKEAFELDFLVPPNSERERRKVHASQVIRRRSGALDARGDVSPAAYESAIADGAELMLKAARARDREAQLNKAFSFVKRQIAAPARET